MYEQHSADKMLSHCRDFWPESDHLVSAFGIYLHRSQHLSLKLMLPIMQKYQINPSEFDVLASLRNYPPPHVLTPTELQRSMLITSGGLTKLLYQLEDRGLISRSVQECDKRSKLVHLTDSGKQLIEDSMQETQQVDRELLDSALNKTEQKQLVKLLGKITRELEKRDGQFEVDDQNVA